MKHSRWHLEGSYPYKLKKHIRQNYELRGCGGIEGRYRQLTHFGMHFDDIAEELGFTPSALSEWRRKWNQFQRMKDEAEQTEGSE